MKLHRPTSTLLPVLAAAVFVLSFRALAGGPVQAGEEARGAACASADVFAAEAEAAIAGLEARDLPFAMGRFPDMDLGKIFEMLSSSGGFEVEIEGAQAQGITLEGGQGTLGEVLVRLATELGLRYQVDGPKRLLVRAPERAGVGGVTLAESVSSPPPQYPEDARRDRTTGKVILETVVCEDGNVGAIRVRKEVAGAPSLTEAAIAALRQREYRPARKDGVPVASYTTVVVEFQLREDRAPTID